VLLFTIGQSRRCDPCYSGVESGQDYFHNYYIYIVFKFISMGCTWQVPTLTEMWYASCNLCSISLAATPHAPVWNRKTARDQLGLVAVRRMSQKTRYIWKLTSIETTALPLAAATLLWSKRKRSTLAAHITSGQRSLMTTRVKLLLWWTGWFGRTQVRLLKRTPLHTHVSAKRVSVYLLSPLMGKVTDASVETDIKAIPT
jgi:hypothetical protein